MDCGSAILSRILNRPPSNWSPLLLLVVCLYCRFGRNGSLAGMYTIAQRLWMQSEKLQIQ